jgi:hypothetical protein
MAAPLVEVTWLDAYTHMGEMALADVPAKAVLGQRRTSGYLLYEDLDGRTIVAHTIDADGVADVTVIPHAWVRGIKYRRRKRA